MFEKITKGEFHLPHLASDGTACNCGFLFVGEEGALVATIHKDGDHEDCPPLEEAKANAEFITYCFNLQQRYNIEALEEAVSALEEAQLHHQGGHSGVGYSIREAIAKIRKP